MPKTTLSFDIKAIDITRTVNVLSLAFLERPKEEALDVAASCHFAAVAVALASLCGATGEDEGIKIFRQLEANALDALRTGKLDSLIPGAKLYSTKKRADG